MERRKFLGRLFGTAAAVVVAPSVFTELEVPAVTPVAIEPVKAIQPWGLGLREQMEHGINHHEYTIIGGEKLINALNDLVAKDVEMSQSTTFFNNSFKPVKSKYHR